MQPKGDLRRIQMLSGGWGEENKQTDRRKALSGFQPDDGGETDSSRIRGLERVLPPAQGCAWRGLLLNTGRIRKPLPDVAATTADPTTCREEKKLQWKPATTAAAERTHRLRCRLGTAACLSAAALAAGTGTRLLPAPGLARPAFHLSPRPAPSNDAAPAATATACGFCLSNPLTSPSRNRRVSAWETPSKERARGARKESIEVASAIQGPKTCQFLHRPSSS